MSNDRSKLMTPGQVREIFGVSKPTELRWRNAGKLPEPIVMSRKVYYRTNEIEKLLNGGGQ